MRNSGVKSDHLLNALFDYAKKYFRSLNTTKWPIYRRYMDKQASFSVHIERFQIDIAAEKVTHIFGCLCGAQGFEIIIMCRLLCGSHTIGAILIYNRHNLIHI